MSQASLIKTLPETLSQPVGLASLASLGIHGLLWVILPVLPLDPTLEAHSQRTVGLVELTTEEQSRLPQAVTPEQSTLPPLPLQQQNELSSLPPPPPYQPSILPPLPPPPSFNLAPLPDGTTPANNYPIKDSLPQPNTFIVPPPPPTQNNQSLPTQFPIGKLPIPPAPIPTYRLGQLPNPATPSQANKIRQSSPLRTLTPPANRGLPNLALKPSAPFVPDSAASQTVQYRISQPPTQQQNQQNIANPQTTQDKINQPQNQQLAANPQPKPATTSARPDKLPERGRQEFLALQQQARARNNRTPASQQGDRALPAANPPTASTPTASTTEQQRRDNLAAQLRSQQAQGNSSANTTSPQAAQTTEQQRRDNLAAQLRSQQAQGNPSANTTSPQTAQTTEQQRRDNLAAQLRSQQAQGNPSANTTSPQTAQTIAQLNAYKERLQTVQQANPEVETKAPIREKIQTCEKQLDGRAAVFGVVFNPDGKMVSGPDFISNNSNADVQQAAKNYLSNYQPQKSDTPIDQSFRLDFQYGGSKCAKQG